MIGYSQSENQLKFKCLEGFNLRTFVSMCTCTQTHKSRVSCKNIKAGYFYRCFLSLMERRDYGYGVVVPRQGNCRDCSKIYYADTFS